MTLRECCKDPKNMEREYVFTVSEDGSKNIDENAETLNVCKVCGRRHFRIAADPGQIGVQGLPTGG